MTALHPLKQIGPSTRIKAAAMSEIDSQDAPVKTLFDAPRNAERAVFLRSSVITF
jgi:hypothetical protein